MVLFRSGTKEWSGPMLSLEICCFFATEFSFCKRILFLFVSLGTQKRLRYSWTTAQKRKPFLWEYMEYFLKSGICCAEHWLAKFEFVNGLLTYWPDLLMDWWPQNQSVFCWIFPVKPSKPSKPLWPQILKYFEELNTIRDRSSPAL